MVSDRVRLALLHPDMCHRVPVFEDILRNVQRNLLTVYKADEDYTILLITGSGTAANETVISSYFKAPLRRDRLKQSFELHQKRNA